MNNVQDQMNEWHLELKNVLSEHQNELNNATELIKDNQYIAAFNYVDSIIAKNNVKTSERFKDITTDLYLSLNSL